MHEECELSKRPGKLAVPFCGFILVISSCHLHEERACQSKVEATWGAAGLPNEICTGIGRWRQKEMLPGGKPQLISSSCDAEMKFRAELVPKLN